MSPLVLSWQLNDFTRLLTIRIQLHFHTLRTKAVFILLVIPLFSYREGRLTWSVRIGNGIAFLVNTWWIILNSFFLKSVDNFLTILKFRKSSKGFSPICLACDIFVGHLFTVGIKIHSNLSRTKAILVVIVSPDLHDWNIHRTWGMCIGQDKITLLLALFCYGVAFRNYYFLNRIVNDLSICFFWKFSKGMSPLIVSRQDNFLAHLLITCIQLNLNFFWTKAILVISIFPFLGYLNLSDSRLMLIGQDRMCWILVINWKGIAFWDILFFYSVVNGLTGCFFIKIFKRSLPLVSFW